MLLLLFTTLPTRLFAVTLDIRSTTEINNWVILITASLIAFIFITNRLLKKHIAASTIDLNNAIVARKTAETEREKAIKNLLLTKVAPGVFWLQIPDAGLYILCGCPDEVVKQLRRLGFIHTETKEQVNYESGPNVILLSDLLVQHGKLSNLAEFPVLQMLYRQGMILPNHPNNSGIKPMIIGTPSQVDAQMDYIYRGNYGLTSIKEIIATGISKTTAELFMKIKLKFAFGTIRRPEDFLDSLKIENNPVEIRNGVTVCRTACNHYTFSYRGESTAVDLNLSRDEIYEPPYPLGHHRFRLREFAVLHTGGGDGWDTNHPCMGSILMYMGRIYLVDASPGISQTLSSLGIDICEVEGVFITHAHDDHFSGLPSLIQSGHRLKYFSTPLVRASVTKKFAALLSINENKFNDFFDIHDIEFDRWNNCNGLEIMPIYSPHPLETNILLFRAKDGDQYKTYAHWADLSSFKVLDQMSGFGKEDVDPEFIKQVKEKYLIPANIKKLDIGGGLIHGLAADYQDDRSDQLILAHLDRKLTNKEMEIGSTASFGALDILIEGEQHFLNQRATNYLSQLFPDAAADEINQLMRCPMIGHNAGSIISKVGRGSDFVELILSGTIIHINGSSKQQRQLAYGSFIGWELLFDEDSINQDTYRALSHSSTIKFPVTLLSDFITRHHIKNQLKASIESIRFLKNTWLFGEKIPFLSLQNIARSLTVLPLAQQEEIQSDNHAEGQLYLVTAGIVNFVGTDGTTLETIKDGDFFLSHSAEQSKEVTWKFRAATESTLYAINLHSLRKIPIIQWKILEAFERRSKLTTPVTQKHTL
ncbi:MAG: MBL fold metallo-hydrolase [Mariprofundus sp.]|nr:MBL fold metallo-hydrolase [Mariprofundus sp.]